MVIVAKKPVNLVSEKHLIAPSPKEALALLTNYQEVIVAGRSVLNSSFMKDGLVEEIFLDVEPYLFGKGIPLFSNEDFESKLRPLETTKLSENEIQLHYAVIK